GATGVRQLYLTKMALLHCYSFENRRKLFEIHRSFKFANVVVGLPQGGDGYPSLRQDLDDVPSGISVKQVWSLQGFRTLAQKGLLHFTQRLSKTVPDPDGVERFLRRAAGAALPGPAQTDRYSTDGT